MTAHDVDQPLDALLGRDGIAVDPRLHVVGAEHDDNQVDRRMGRQDGW
ncbi:hypothetical protein X734_19530 [Mesorhizobium sp. L2C084A000]|nr:hypothetical protein X734_19530 [Mesorhizobium sp. L2C084A000]